MTPMANFSHQLSSNIDQQQLITRHHFLDHIQELYSGRQLLTVLIESKRMSYSLLRNIMCIEMVVIGKGGWFEGGWVINFEQFTLEVSIQIHHLMTTWYGKSASKQIESLIENKASLQALLAVPDFSQELKSYNSKLLEYITSNPWLISQAITYLTVPPSTTDSEERKFKLPLQVIEMVETETVCVLNGFFREGEGGIHNLDLMFKMLDQEEVLPLLAGYFFRTNLCLLNNKYKETVERIYSKPKLFHQLISHSHLMALSNSIQLFLNLDVNKNSLGPQPERLAVKLDVVKAILKKMEEEGRRRGPDSAAMVQNLSSVLIETVDKYYLIVDGKQMIEALTDQPSIDIIMGLASQNHDVAFPAFSLFISLINYYSFSSFNGDDAEVQKNEKLDREPMIEGMIQLFGRGLDKVMAAPKMDIYHYRLLEVLCHCISISSTGVLTRICEVRFFGNLIELMFKHEECNILHMLIEKSFYHVFISERKIYEEYKRHLFCDIDIIECTANRMLRLFSHDHFLKHASKKSYFGHFMRILRIYSGIKPTDQRIIEAIKSKTSIWSKISELLIKPYEEVTFKELGTYEDVPTPLVQEFKIQKHGALNTLPHNDKAIQEVEEEERIKLSNQQPKKIGSTTDSTSGHSYLFDNEPYQLVIPDTLPIVNPIPPPKESPPLPKESPSEIKKKESYGQFLEKSKIKAGKDIELKRSSSQDRKLSNGSRKGMTSPSPKRNNWNSNNSAKQQAKPGQRPSSKDPGIPIGRRPTTNASTSAQRQNRLMKEDEKSPRKVNMEEVKKIKVIQIDVPKEKKYRRVSQKDQPLLDFLGLSI